MMSFYRTLKTATIKRQKSGYLPGTLSKSVENSITDSESMVSRRRILSRSRDDLRSQAYVEEESDVWYDKDKLFREHIQEVLDKWTQIDDEIWAKIIVFEKNRRVAKAYARTPVLTINGSDDGFDGMRIGLCGFDNPMRDHKTEEVKRHIGQGVKLKMDDNGNILARRYAKSGIFVKTVGNPSEENAIGNEILKCQNFNLELEKVMKVFDMKKFESNVNRELRRAYPDRRRLEMQCLSIVSFVKTETDILECPVWILIINVVAIDMLKAKLPQLHRPVDIKNRPRIPIPDEDPYAVAAEIDSSGSSFGLYGQGPHVRRDKPPKLPPRDNLYARRDERNGLVKADYDEIDEDVPVQLMFKGRPSKKRNTKSYDDPYYCGLRARVPDFSRNKPKPSEAIYVSSSSKNRPPHVERKSRRSISQVDRHQPAFSSLYQLNQINDPRSSLYQRLHHHSYNMVQPSQPRHFKNLWHRSCESGIDSEIFESPYQIYGRTSGEHQSRMKQSGGYISSNFRNSREQPNYIGNWE